MHVLSKLVVSSSWWLSLHVSNFELVTGDWKKVIGITRPEEDAGGFGGDWFGGVTGRVEETAGP